MGNRITIGIAIAISILAVILVTIAIVTHDEQTMMTACNTDHGRFDYTGECFPVRMSGSPPFVIDIHLEGGRTYNMNYVAILESEVSSLNIRLGRNILVLSDVNDGVCSGDICYMPEQPRSDDWIDSAGTASHYMNGGKCAIKTSNTGNIELESMVLLHEIGHCLGLAHDDFDISIMRHVQTPTPDNQIGPWITDMDKEAILNTYWP